MYIYHIEEKRIYTQSTGNVRCLGFLSLDEHDGDHKCDGEQDDHQPALFIWTN